MTLDDRITATERRVTALERRVGEPGRWFADAPTRSKDNYADATSLPWNGPRYPDGRCAPLGSFTLYAPTPSPAAAGDAHHEPGAPGGPRDAAGRVTAWANRYTLGELSMSEADAWRAGRDACVHAVRAIAARLRARADNDQQCLACVSTLDIAADQLAQMEPRAEVTGLCERGA